MRLFVAVAFVTLAAHGTAAAQTARCVLSPRPYGLGGECQVEPGEPGTRMRLPFENGVKIWMTAGPGERPPWRGNLSLPKVETSFEIVEERGNERRLVFRTGLAWLLVREWRETEAGPKEDCSSCDRSAKTVSLVLDLGTAPLATGDDVAILRGALATLEEPAHWNRKEEQRCPAGQTTSIGLFCALFTAVEDRMGRYQHRQPALEIVRSVIFERWRQRITGHQLVDMNNHPETTLDDLRTLLEVSLQRVRDQMRPQGFLAAQDATSVTDAESAVVQWLRANAIPIATERPGGPMTDLEPLRRVVGDTKLVLLGEATHGTREFFQLKHRFIEYLASALGFNTLITEAEWSRTRDAIAVLATPGGRPEDAYTALRRWRLTAEPAVDLLAWAQRYNRDTGRERLAIRGMDMQDPWRSAERLLAYLQRVDPAAAMDLANALRPLEGRAGNYEAIRAYSRQPPDVLANLRTGIARARARLQKQRAEYIARSSTDAWTEAAHEARVLQQGEEIYGTPGWPQGAGDKRDRFMAENVVALTQSSSGAIVWAHNAHVMRARWVGRETLGGHLSRLPGSRMVVVGFAFDKGEFRARIPNGGAVAVHTLGAAPSGSISAMLARVGLPMFLVDLRTAPRTGPVADWLRTSHPERSVGAEFHPDAEPVMIAPGASYDVLVFVATTTWRQR